MPHLDLGPPGEYLTDQLTDEALKVIDHAAATAKPLFLWLAHHAPHTPLEAKPADIAHFETRLHPGLTHKNPVYAAMIKSLDDSVGRVLARLRDRHLDTNTIVVFTSDNGGYLGTDRRQSIPVTTNAPLRSGKGTLYEGGLRVPLIIRWPGVTPARVECSAVVSLTDLYYTLLPAVGLQASNSPQDGVDLSPLLKHPTATLARGPLFFHYPHYYHAPVSAPASAVLAWPWKLIEHLEDQQLELFDLGQDPSESHDLSGQDPARTAALLQDLHRWRQSIGAAMPSPNPGFKAGPP